MTDFTEIKELFDEGMELGRDARTQAKTALERLDELETRLNRPGATGPASQEETEHKDAFVRWLRDPSDANKSALSELETKVSSSLTDAAGGHIVPEIIARPLQFRTYDQNTLRAICRVEPVGSTSVTFPLSNRDATSGWVGETATRTGTTEPTLRGVTPSFGTLYAYPEASEELVMDSVFNIGDWFAEEAGSQMGSAEAVAVVSGDGADKPTGFLNTAPEAGGDGARTAGALQYFPSGTSGALGADNGAITDNLNDILYGVKSQYRSNGTWVMNSATAGVLSKMKDTDDRPIWREGLAEGQPNLLLGYRVVISEQMPDIAADSHPIAFGDFRRGYVLCDRGPLRVTLDDNITVPGRVKWYVRRRVGGVVVDDFAIKVLKCSAT